jgi:hypothetical protein
MRPILFTLNFCKAKIFPVRQLSSSPTQWSSNSKTHWYSASTL